MPMNLTSLKSVHSPTLSIAAQIGTGHKTVAKPLHTVGSPKADFSHIVGKATMRPCFYISWDWARLLIHCRRAATLHGLPLIVGNTVTDMIFYSRDRYSLISSPMSGLIFVAFRMRSCVKKASIISRTA